MSDAPRLTPEEFAALLADLPDEMMDDLCAMLDRAVMAHAGARIVRENEAAILAARVEMRAPSGMIELPRLSALHQLGKEREQGNQK